MKNKLISEGRYTDAVDEALIKVINAKKNIFDVPYTWLYQSWYGFFYYKEEKENEGTLGTYISVIC